VKGMNAFSIMPIAMEHIDGKYDDSYLMAIRFA
jgi:hypothetical protein